MEQLVKPSIDDDSFLELPERYKITSLLGKQPGRRTFLAQDHQTDTPVVIKLVLFGPDFTWQELKLFEREAETLKSLDHPAIPKYLDSFEVNTHLGQGYALVQTYIEAPSLKEIVESGHRFKESQLQPIAQALLSILYHLHNCYPMVIHRDIKPSNILLKAKTKETPAKLYLIDFGSVQTAQTDGTMTIVGTYGYMPPEQFGGRAKPASDLYSLGATLIYLATGKHPTELSQESLQIQFSEHVDFSASFTQWLTQLTHTSLTQRTATAKQALQQLKSPRQQTANAEPSLPEGAVVQASKLLPQKFSRGDLSIVFTPHNLEITCLRSRIREPLHKQLSIRSLHKSGHRKRTGIAGIFVTGISALSWSAIGLLILHMWKNGIHVLGVSGILGLLPLIFMIQVVASIPCFWYPRYKHNDDRKVSLKLFHRHDHTILLSLTTLPLGNNPKAATKKAGPVKTKPTRTETAVTHFSDLPLNLLRTLEKPSYRNSYVRLTTLPDFSFGSIFPSQTALSKREKKLPPFKRYHHQFRISGTRSDMRWLAKCITQWRYDTTAE